MKSTMSTSNMIVPEVLTKYNYGLWKTFMKNYLVGQGLWDIVDGIECKPEDTTTPEFKNWREKNGKALHAILISCEDEFLSFINMTDSAKDVWYQLFEMFQGRTSQFRDVDRIADDSVNATRNRALYKAVFWGDWERTKALLDENPVDSLTAIISPAGGTVLHVAVATGHLKIVEKLVEMMSPEAILARTTQTKSLNLTPLGYAARSGFTKIAEVLVKKNNYALRIGDSKFGLIPVAAASWFGHKDTTRYLYAVTMKESLIEGDCKSGAALLNTAIWHEMYGAPTYNERDKTSPDVGDTKRGHFTIEVSRLLYGVVWSALNLIVPGIKSIQSKKRIHVQALKVLKCICSQLSTMGEREFEKVGVYDGLFRATTLGIVEIVKEIIKINPKLIFILNKKDQNIFSVAILYRQEKIFNLIRGMDGQMIFFSSSLDDVRNTILHLAGKSPLFSHDQDEMPGAALQMQRELQWFQEVEKLVPFAREARNVKGLKPQEVFTEEHKELVREGEKWMKDTANSCMVVTTLIAAFTFSAAFTAPGGSNQESGFPIFLRHKVFLLFIISDALSLFSSATSLLMFLSIYTSRYAENDFLKSLPKRLIIGLSTLFFSIATMMVAFCATLFLILTKQYIWLAIPITFLASVPVTLFVLLQFPLFLDMVLSTYRPGLFNKPKKI
ncbi:ankyrin repeat-containing protein ITN1-like isoform X2 [Macadamia integrifolia]|uniref:ankyrin repeat-containing protein ITN1-like isoform X2 n=1 Tax=Macadamia integrifolia TaxID=60698 RepID=UPI001C4E5F3B|nr:ankyrin repeat-containing protein ITN1-like isoform X2 [Macadamia integrifolia]